MAVTRPYNDDDVAGMCDIWNEVVKDGIAFPQEKPMEQDEAASFFAGQTCCGVATDEGTGDVLGLFILHANNVGRCGHIANASYAVSSIARGKHIGRSLVEASMDAARNAGFRILQFNAVVATNVCARHLYESLGFRQLGMVTGGFRMPDDSYADIYLYYIEL